MSERVTKTYPTSEQDSSQEPEQIEYDPSKQDARVEKVKKGITETINTIDDLDDIYDDIAGISDAEAKALVEAFVQPIGQ